MKESNIKKEVKGISLSPDGLEYAKTQAKLELQLKNIDPKIESKPEKYNVFTRFALGLGLSVLLGYAIGKPKEAFVIGSLISAASVTQNYLERERMRHNADQIIEIALRHQNNVLQTALQASSLPIGNANHCIAQNLIDKNEPDIDAHILDRLLREGDMIISKKEISSRELSYNISLSIKLYKPKSTGLNKTDQSILQDQNLQKEIDLKIANLKNSIQKVYEDLDLSIELKNKTLENQEQVSDILDYGIELSIKITKPIKISTTLFDRMFDKT